MIITAIKRYWYYTFIILIISCKGKESSINQSTNKIADLLEFPKEWVLLVDLTPDSISRSYHVSLMPDSSFYGVLTIQQKDSTWTLLYKSFDALDSFTINSCKRTEEAEMIYYNFDLLSTSTSTPATLQVNYRSNPESGQCSIFIFKDDDEEITYELIPKSFVSEFPVWITEGYD